MASNVYNDEKVRRLSDHQNDTSHSNNQDPQDSDTCSIITISDIDFDRYTITTEDDDDTMSIQTELPAYSSVGAQNVQISEKQDTSTATPNPTSLRPCKTHQPSQTPAIDKQLQSPINRASLLALSEAIADLADDNHCTKCTADTLIKTLGAVSRDLKAAKQSGSMTKEEKKALKREFKVLGKGMKADYRGMKQEFKEVQRGLKDEERSQRGMGY